MLKGIDPLLTPELLMHLCAMGHGEWVAVVDANFTADMLAKRFGGLPVVRLPGHSLARVSEAVLSVFPLAADVPQPVAYMQHSDMPQGQTTAAQAEVMALAQTQAGIGAARVQGVERFAFYERFANVSLIVQSGEATAFGNALFCKGVIL